MEGQLDEGGMTTGGNFLGLPPDETGFDAAEVVILPVPYDATASYRTGSRHGPQALIDASRQVELHDEELEMEPYRAGIHTAAPLGTHAGGPDEMGARVNRAVTEILERGKFPFLVGGDHSISVGAVQALASRFPRLAVLQFDAHADLRDIYQGTKWSHACVARRIHELGVQLVQLGVRAFSREEAEFSKEAGVTAFSARAILSDVTAVARALDSLDGPLYVTFDVDALDSGIMPSTGTPEPGGLDWHTVLALLKDACERHAVVGCDLVELSPVAGLVAPDFLAARLAYKMIAYRALSPGSTEGGEGE